MAYQYGATSNTAAAERERQRILFAKREREEQIAAKRRLRALQARKRRRSDQFPPTTPEALQTALERCRRMFPEPDSIKDGRRNLLDLEAHLASRYTKLKEPAL